MRKTAQDRKVEISQAAMDLAFEVGPDQVTTSIIAKRLGLTQPAIYKHFPNKNGIWNTVADQLCGQVRVNIERAANGIHSPDNRIRLLVMGHLQLVQENPALPEIMVMRNLQGAHGHLQSQMRTIMAEFRNALVGHIEAAVSQKIFQSDLDSADASTLVFGIIQSLVLRMLLTRDPNILTQDGARLLDLLLSGFRHFEGSL
ncbi:nucleoid occlusion factor SlmA (plasmid) [Maritalea myrionectae]|uniref:Nucleoid occlusion factor SlmA n=1 Tax=Maritalea myrionectae TaxID=454601 RepID=A0A2R4MJ72_9HYPH|nr:TetR/AcrR family transcriptional regulator [Maritalea myrionectae]AVX06028.1 nucleoid occlusion factor SlmA [Maritalea myrionectae]